MFRSDLANGGWARFWQPEAYEMPGMADLDVDVLEGGTDEVYEIEAEDHLELLAPIGSVLDELRLPPLHRRVISEAYQFTGDPAIKVAFLDADGNLRVSKSGSVSANSDKDVALLPGVPEKLAELVEDGYFIAIVSNQGGVGSPRVDLTAETAENALSYTIELIREAGGDVHYMDFAPDNDRLKKPETGMIEDLETALKKQFGNEVYIDKDNSMMIGDAAYKKAKWKKETGDNGEDKWVLVKAADKRPDGTDGTDFSNSDRLLAENFGIPFFEPNMFFGWNAHGIDRFENNDELAAFQARFSTQ